MAKTIAVVLAAVMMTACSSAEDRTVEVTNSFALDPATGPTCWDTYVQTDWTALGTTPPAYSCSWDCATYEGNLYGLVGLTFTSVDGTWIITYVGLVAEGECYLD